MVFGDHLIPRHQSVSFTGFTAEDCRQSAIHARLDRRIVILLLPNILFKSIQVPRDAIDVQILHLAAAISPLIATKPGLALVANLRETVLPVGNTIAGKAMCVLEVFTTMILDQIVVKSVRNRIDIRRVAMWIIPNGSRKPQGTDGMPTGHPECSINGVNASIHEETAPKLNIIDPNQIPQSAFDSLRLGWIRKCFVCVEGTEHPGLTNQTFLTTLDGLDIEGVRGNLKINQKDLLADRSRLSKLTDDQSPRDIDGHRFGHVHMNTAIDSSRSVFGKKTRWRLQEYGIDFTGHNPFVARQTGETTVLGNIKAFACLLDNLLKIISQSRQMVTFVILCHHLGNQTASSTKSDESDFDPGICLRAAKHGWFDYAEGCDDSGIGQDRTATHVVVMPPGASETTGLIAGFHLRSPLSNGKITLYYLQSRIYIVRN